MANKKKNRFFLRKAILLVLAGAIVSMLYNNANKEKKGVLKWANPHRTIN